MPEQKPKIEFPTNTPKIVTVRKMFKQGQGEYGNWYAYDATENGVEVMFFAKDALHQQISQFNLPCELVINYAERKGEKGVYHQWDVHEPVFDGKGELTQAPKSIVTDEPYRESVTSDLEGRALVALQTARRVVQKFNASLDPTNDDVSDIMDHADIRALGISFLIGFDKKGIS